MTSHLPVVRLGDYCEVDSGFAFKSERFSQNSEDINLVKGSNLGHRTIDWDEGPKWSKDEFEKLRFYELVTDDVLLAMDRPIVGGNLKFAWMSESDPQALLVQRVARLRAKDGLDQIYLRYVIADSAFKLYIDTITTGANIPHISGPDIRDYKFPLPSITTQKKIAAILSAYDDLIENNLKRIKLLEEIAQITYEEWFVRLKFPGHETTPLDSATGLPPGWSNAKLGAFIKFHKGKKLDEIFDTSVPGSSKILLLDSLESGVYKYALSKGHVKTVRGDLIMLMDGARSSCVFFAENGIVGSTISKITSDKIPYTLLYHFFKSHLEWLQINNTGAAIPHANKQFINKINFKTPSDDIFNLWQKTIEPIYQTIWNLKDQNQLLKEARDILLPRLMTGMIDVEQLVLPESAENLSPNLGRDSQAA